VALPSGNELCLRLARCGPVPEAKLVRELALRARPLGGLRESRSAGVTGGGGSEHTLKLVLAGVLPVGQAWIWQRDGECNS